jgi:hypothetical protein
VFNRRAAFEAVAFASVGVDAGFDLPAVLVALSTAGRSSFAAIAWLTRLPAKTAR